MKAQTLREIILILAGVLFIVNAIYVGLTGDFIFWKLSKVVYLVGVLFFVFSKERIDLAMSKI